MSQTAMQSKKIKLMMLRRLPGLRVLWEEEPISHVRARDEQEERVFQKAELAELCSLGCYVLLRSSYSALAVPERDASTFKTICA